jgi:hypothetical protein
MQQLHRFWLEQNIIFKFSFLHVSDYKFCHVFGCGVYSFQERQLDVLPVLSIEGNRKIRQLKIQIRVSNIFFI